MRERPSAPRFLNFGDRFELPIVVENQSGSAQSVLVGARASNATLTAGRARRVDVPAHDRVELRLPVATRASGRALLQVAVQAKAGADAAQLEGWHHFLPRLATVAGGGDPGPDPWVTNG